MAQTLYPNLAHDSAARDLVETKLLPTLPRVRSERKTLETSWMRYYRIWSAERDQQSYQGRSRVYVPIGRRVIENWVQKLKRDLFADADSYFDVLALRQSFEQRRDGIKTLFRYFLEKHMRLRRKVTPFLRQCVTYGTSPVAMAWRYDESILPVLRDIEDADGNITGKTERAIEHVVNYVGPTFRVCDLFAWYISPVTCEDPKDSNLCFEELLLNRDRLRELATVPIGDDEALGMMFENTDEALNQDQSSADTSDKYQAEQQRLASKGFTARYDAKDPARPIDLTEVYWKYDLDGTGIAWWRVTIAGDRVPLRIQKNPFWHGRPPWLAGKFVELTNEFYGRGLPETFDRMQYTLNDIGDQANDALTWCMNPIAIVDSYNVQDPASIRMRPGAKWLATPDAIKFTEPPKETPAVGYNAVQQFAALINDTSAAAAFAPGAVPNRSKGRAFSTATGANLAATEMSVQVRDVVENLEDQVFEPMLFMMHTLTMQCLSRPMILRIAGADGASIVEHKLSAADVVGDYDFAWLGSTHTQNQQVRSQQMINYLQIAAKIPPQLLASQNMVIDYGYLLKAIWAEGMGLRNADRVIRPIKPTHSLDPRIENDLFVVGRGDEVQVAEADIDELHLKVHDEGLRNPLLTPWGHAQLMAHMQQHIASAMAKAVLQQQQAMQAQLQQGVPPLNGAGRPGAPGGAQPNPGRLDQTSTPADVLRGMPRDMTGGGIQ
jgi:hypothetical protein